MRHSPVWGGHMRDQQSFVGTGTPRRRIRKDKILSGIQVIPNLCTIRCKVMQHQKLMCSLGQAQDNILDSAEFCQWPVGRHESVRCDGSALSLAVRFKGPHFRLRLLSTSLVTLVHHSQLSVALTVRLRANVLQKVNQWRACLTLRRMSNPHGGLSVLSCALFFMLLALWQIWPMGYIPVSDIGFARSGVQLALFACDFLSYLVCCEIAMVHLSSLG